MDEKGKAEKSYNDIVDENLKKILEGEIDDIEDPDEKSKYSIEIDGVSILLSQDGLCSKKRIVEFCGEDVKKQKDDYELIRSKMFGVLFWPAYAMSINTMRNSKFKDRIDLLLNDIHSFYEIVDEKTELTSDVVKRIWENCKLARAYLFPNTFYWLRSFKNFSGFIKKDKKDISCFVPNPIGEPWPGTGKGFTKEYYEALLSRIREYKKI